VAYKTGEITKIHHHAAIVFAKRPFILVILVRGLAEKKYSAPLMADASKILYEAGEMGPGHNPIRTPARCGARAIAIHVKLPENR
jgi:hypothetical protein